MSDEPNESETSSEPLPSYEPPRVVETLTFETLALSCTKTDAQIPSCSPGNPIFPLPGIVSSS
jgi:hypothetical protein